MNQNKKEVQLYFIFSLIAFLELIISGVFTLLVSPDPKNAWILGLSKQRWALALIIIILAFMFFISGRIAKHHNTTIKYLVYKRTSRFWQRVIEVSAFIFMLWGWCSIFCPPYLFADWAHYYERIRPLSNAIGLVLLQFGLLSFVFDNRLKLINFPALDRKSPFFRASLFFIVSLILLASFIGITKIGLVKDTAYWNVVGIPISGLQFLALVIAISLGIYFSSSIERTFPSREISRYKRFLPFLIYFGTVLVWGLTPMLKHFFSLQPTFPTFQPLPWSDARWLDLGGLSILKGYGINFHNVSDKPLYMVFLAILHLFAGNNYSLLTWLQIFVLSLTPVVLFLLGKKYLNQSFGLFLALIMIIRQRNSIFLSYKIASVNPKLLVSEMMTLLGIILFTYLVFLWFRNPKPWSALMAGGVLGAMSLIRMNLLLIFPIIGLMALVSMWKLQKTKWRLLVLYSLGFFLITSPWLISGVDVNGTPIALVKINAIIQSRYQLIPQATQKPPGLPLIREAHNTIQENSVPKKIFTIYQQKSTSPLNTSISVQFLSVQTLISNENINVPSFLDLFANHFLHNMVTSTLALPDSLVYDDLDHLRLRPYWIEGSNWQGDIPPIQVFVIMLNIIFIAIGLGYSWSRYQWVGLVPLVIFFGYDMSLAFAMNSGSRYIVPIDWIMYFYFGLSLVCIIRWVNNMITGQNQIISVEAETVGFIGLENKNYFWQSLAILIVIASLIPIANNVLPMVITPPNLPDNSELLLNSIPDAQKVDIDISIGELLYPYYGIDSTFQFDFLKNGTVSSYSINLDPQPLKETVVGGENILLGINAGHIDYIYLISGNSLELIWGNNGIISKIRGREKRPPQIEGLGTYHNQVR